MRIAGCSAATNAATGRRFRGSAAAFQCGPGVQVPSQWNPRPPATLWCESGPRRRCCRFIAASGRGKTIVSVIPTKPSPAKPSAAKPSTDKPLAGKSPPTKPLPGERQLPSANEGTPVPDSKGELPPVIRRTEVVAIALVGLLIICIIAGLYLAKAFFLPMTMAFIVGTMLSPAASFIERYRIPRSLAAVLLVATAGAGVTFMIGLIASPAMEWSSKLPELGALLKEKLHVFDRPLALWQELQSMLGGPDTLSTLHMPKFDWVAPTLEFLS